METRSLRAESLRRLALEAMEEVLKLESLPSDNDFEDGDVIWYRRKFNPADDREYTYAAVKIAGVGWVTTSVRGDARYLSWDQLCELFVSGHVSELWVATAWRKIELP
jgi:hypothetical protein